MENMEKVNTHERILISKDNIIIDVDENFLDLSGYMKSEIVGKTLLKVSKILRIDRQVDLGSLEEGTNIFLFTKELVPIEGTISCQTMDNGGKKVFLFQGEYDNWVMEKFELADQLGRGRGDGVAILSFPGLILINSNQNNLDFLEPPYNKKSESIGKNIIEISLKYWDVKFNDIKDHIINTGTPFYIEEIIIDSRLFGKSYWNITLVPIFKDKNLKYILLSLSNVTKKVWNRKAIKQKNEELEAVIKNISNEIIIFDKDLNVTMCNQCLKNILYIDNSSSNNLNNITKHSIVFDKDEKLISNENLPFQRVARGEVVSDYLIQINNSLGQIYREVSGSPIYDKDGNFSAGVMVYRDVENRIKREEERLIKTQKELLAKVVEALDLEYIRCTYPELNIVSVNGNGLKSLENINIGKSYFKMYPIDEETKRKELEIHLIEKGSYSYIDYTNHIIDGETRFFKTINQPIFGLNNKVVEIIFITIDITDEVKSRNKVEETLEMQNQMFSIVSHELKTPLSVILSASQLIEIYLKEEINRVNKEGIGRNINIIKQNCYRFNKLINNIIDLSSIESGFYRLNLENRNIIKVVEDISDSVRSYVEEKGVNIKFDTDTEEKIIALDVDKIERIMLNLISNAVKFSYKGESIYIEIKTKEDFVEILVQDYGVGINKKDLDTIFDKYKKVDNSLSRNAEGSGIGLALVKTMVGLIGGEISVESRLGKGSLFRVKLPVRVLEESEAIDTTEDSNNIIEQINIEFSDIYTK